MDYNSSGNRGYNEKEIGELIQRATELHEKAAGSSDRVLTLTEIEQIASELGLSPEHLKTAAREMDAEKNSDKSFSLWGAPFVVDQRRVVNKIMTDEEWADIVFELRNFSGRTGKISEVGRTRQWSHYVGEGDEGINFTKMQVSVRPKDGQTSIQIQKHFGFFAALYPLAFFASMFVSIAIINDIPDPTFELLLPGSILGSMALVRGLIAQRSNRYKQKLSRLADRFQDILSASSSSVSDRETARHSELAAPSDANAETVELPDQNEALLDLPETDEFAGEQNETDLGLRTTRPETRE